MKRAFLILAGIGTAALLFAASNTTGPQSKDSESSSNLTKVSGLRDIHGLTVDVTDSSKIYLASHTGLHLLKNDADLYVVGNARDDYMDFSADPKSPDTFYSSGHPSSGGNIGFQKTTDGGLTWEKVSDGVNGPVDFHALAVSQVDPDIIYGSYAGAMQRSIDNGKTWTVLKDSLQRSRVISLTTDSTEKDTVYAATDNGLMVSRDQAATWQSLSSELAGDLVVSLAINPKNNLEMIAYAQKMGLAKSLDGGKTWISQKPELASAPVLALAYDKSKPNIVYGVNQKLEIHKTVDGSTTWSRVR